MPLSPEAIAAAAELFGAVPDDWRALKRSHICPLPGRRWLLLEVFPVGTSAALVFMDGDYADDKRTIRAVACALEGRRYIGAEIDPERHRRAVLRVQAAMESQ